MRFAKKSLGQNFLVDPNYIRRIIATLDLEESDTIIEIGPGRGAITERLVESGAKVIAVELDRDLVPVLRETFAAKDNFSIVEADATTVDFEEITKKKETIDDQPSAIKLVANLPYYISTSILQQRKKAIIKNC